MKKILATFLFLFSNVTLASTFELKTIDVVVPFSAGGPTDQLWRTIESEMNKRLQHYKIRLSTENIPGAGGSVGANKVALDDKPRLGFFSPAIAIAPNTIPDSVRYDLNSFRFVAYAGESQMQMISSLVNLGEFKKKCVSNTIFYGSSGVGSISHLFGQLVGDYFSCKKLVHVPYKGLSQSYSDLISGRIDYVIDFDISSKQLIDSNRVFRIIKVDEKFKNQLGAWHVLLANNKVDQQTLKIIKEVFDDFKNDESAVNRLEKTVSINNFKEQKNELWLKLQFENYKNFIKNTVK